MKTSMQAGILKTSSCEASAMCFKNKRPKAFNLCMRIKWCVHLPKRPAGSGSRYPPLGLVEWRKGHLWKPHRKPTKTTTISKGRKKMYMYVCTYVYTCVYGTKTNTSPRETWRVVDLQWCTPQDGGSGCFIKYHLSE